MNRILLASAMWAGLASLPAMAADSEAGAPVTDAQTYRSAFSGFKPFVEERETDWTAANERVRQTGGHGGALEGGDDDATDTPSSASHGRHR